MTNETIFGRILRKEIPADIVFEDEQCIAFRDINPQAPVHIVIIPREYITGLAGARPEHEAILGHLLVVAGEIARRMGIADSGYRVVTNSGPHGQQSVYHIHLHLIGGRQLEWPPG